MKMPRKCFELTRKCYLKMIFSCLWLRLLITNIVMKKIILRNKYHYHIVMKKIIFRNKYQRKGAFNHNAVMTVFLSAFSHYAVYV